YVPRDTVAQCNVGTCDVLTCDVPTWHVRTWHRVTVSRGTRSIRRSMTGRAEFFADTNRDGQPVFTGGNRTLVARVVEAIGMVGAVEVEVVDAGGRAIEIEIPAALVGFAAVGQVAERHEQPAHVVFSRVHEGGERHGLSLQREAELSDPAHLALDARGRRH